MYIWETRKNCVALCQFFVVGLLKIIRETWKYGHVRHLRKVYNITYHVIHISLVVTGRDIETDSK